jgi:hypothetical protein
MKTNQFFQEFSQRGDLQETKPKLRNNEKIIMCFYQKGAY